MSPPADRDGEVPDTAVELRPRAWRPRPDRGLSGPFAPNRRLAVAELKDIGGVGPEDVLVGPDGSIWTGVADGRILRIPSWDDPPEMVADTGGRPLGLDWHPDGSLIVCDADRGLLRVDAGAVEVLADRVEGQRLRFVNNAAVAGDGTIYFTDTSRRFGIRHSRSDLLEHSNSGRLLRRHPDGALEVLMDGLSFANGVALAPDESFVLVAETGEYRIKRLVLDGPSAGAVDVFADNLPGIPDNLATGPGGTIWAPMVTPRNRALDRVLPFARLRALMGRLPDRLQPQPVRYGIVFGFDAGGRVIHNLQDPAGGLAMITGAREHEGMLYLGSLADRCIGRVRLVP